MLTCSVIIYVQFESPKLKCVGFTCSLHLASLLIEDLVTIVCNHALSFKHSVQFHYIRFGILMLGLLLIEDSVIILCNHALSCIHVHLCSVSLGLFNYVVIILYSVTCTILWAMLFPQSTINQMTYMYVTGFALQT